MTAGLARLFLICAALWAGLGAPARALDIRCVEPSRYRELLQVFNDDAAAFYQYFGLERGRPLAADACRAAVVTGQIGPGDADRLLAEIARNKGWLGTLFIAFSGSDPQEEARLAHIVRSYWLRVWAARSPTIRYQPDFITLAASPNDGQSEQDAARGDGGPLEAGLKAYLRRGDLALALNAAAPDCIDSCAGVWAGGVNRRTWFHLSLLNRPAPPPPPPFRAALLAWLDGEAVGRGVEGRRALVSPARVAVMPPEALGHVEEQCGIEIAAVNSVSRRIGGAVNDAAGKGFGVGAWQMGAVASQFDSLRNAGARLQQCVSGALERKRVAAFARQCPDGCDLPKLRAAVEAAAGAILARAPRP